ncbi:TIGR03032 family protein [Spirulina subsalsa]|uniref:TIGR03032 family protein n=1 Tax=Spirulina subsalsa TaxID=54311 RepID=UPI001ED99E71|nr:TIGR03032 family protein [Spirulina subsalsa]
MQNPLSSVHTSNFPHLLNQLGISLIVSTYQAGKVVILRSEGEVLNTHFRVFDKPMGMVADANRLAIGTHFQIIEFRNIPAVIPRLKEPGPHDACYLPRKTHITGDIDIHEMTYIDEELWFINTRFSCLCTLEDRSSFVPRWRPPFITHYALEDRCHLNGLAVGPMNQPQYVTALGATNTPEGWRKTKATGGILMDIPSNEIITQSLSMPHSPRWYDGRLWVLESGKGSLATVDLNGGKLTPVAQLPGFTRGLSFYGRWAFVGLSQVRETAVFSGIPISQQEERCCGVWVVDIDRGETVAFLRFEDAVQEVFAVEVLPGIRFPELIEWDEELLKTSFALPDEALQEVVHPSPELAMQSPNHLFELGNQAYETGEREKAIAHYQDCLALQPDYIPALYNLGVIYRDDPKTHDLALAQFRQILEFDPHHAESYNNLGILYNAQNQMLLALAHYRQALTLRPDLPTLHFNLGMALLTLGQWAEGFQECEWRWQTPEFTPFDCPHPRWDGRPLPQQTLLIHTEQGAGDAIQFIRYLPLAAQRCSRVLLVCVPELRELFASVPGIDQILPPGPLNLEDFHSYIPLMSLPHVLQVFPDTHPTPCPYLHITPAPHPQLPPSPLPKVGIVWGGSPTHKNDHNRSATLKDFLPLLQQSNFQWYSLQKGERVEELKELPDSCPVADLSPFLTDFAATARLIQELDLVITVDTSVAHLAGALGKQVWTLLCYAPDWRWMLDRRETPWYPTMTLFRQTLRQDWSGVISRVMKELSLKNWGFLRER